MVSGMPLRARRGAVSLGCLVTLLAFAAAGYVGINVGEVYWRYYKFRYEMRELARMADRRTDADIQRRLRVLADSLELPEEAKSIHIERGDRSIAISTDYTERVDLRFFSRDFHFQPYAQGSY